MEIRMMRTRATTGRNDRTTDRYFELIQRFPLRPIRTEAENDEALAVIGELMRIEKRDSAENDYFEMLVREIETFEESAYPSPSNIPDGDYLIELMREQSLTQSDVARAVGMSESTVSAIITGKREFTRRQLERVAAFFDVPLALFRTRDAIAEAAVKPKKKRSS
jgi:HTH-type transcriptional regulator/antitoxin HigA